ncbi:MAG: hypothetical protein ACR2F8_11580 [Caulobacteraceae bacterium]
MVRPKFPKPTVTALVILAILLGIVLIARQALDQPQPTRVAQAILSGKAQALTMVTADAQDRDLMDDEAAAGAMWAKSHGATDPTECPLDPPALRRGCAAYVAAHSRRGVR